MHSPEWIGCNMKDCPEDIQQWYLRVQHPFLILEVIENKAWKEFINLTSISLQHDTNLTYSQRSYAVFGTFGSKIFKKFVTIT